MKFLYRQITAWWLCVGISCYAQTGWVQQGPEIIPKGPAYLGFATALSSDGNTALISELGNEVIVMVRSAGQWTVQARLQGSGQIGLAEFGDRVGISGDGNTAAIGGPSDNSQNGAVWVFSRSGTNWTEQAKLVGAGASAPASQGTSVALSQDGNTLIEGGSPDSNEVQSAWVFTRTGNLWGQQGQKLAISNVATGSIWSGAGLSADGNTAVLAAANASGTAGVVFGRSGGVWVQQGSGLTGPPDGACSATISADGNTILLGDAKANNQVGGVWVFVRSGGTWVGQGELSWSDPSPQRMQGLAVSLSSDGNTALVGAPSSGAGLSGAGYIYMRSGGTWTQGSQLVASGAAVGSAAGWAAALSGDGRTALLGGPFDLYAGGAAWFFVNPVATNTSLAMPASPIPFESAMALTATVTPAVPLFSVPGGTVRFSGGSKNFGEAILDSSGKAVLAVTVSVGTYMGVIAAYSGDGLFLGSNSPSATFTIQKAVTTEAAPVLVSGVTNPPGQPLRLSAETSSALGMLTGTTTFLDGTTSLGSSGLDATGTAYLTVPGLAAGLHNISAVFNGDATHLASAGSPVLPLTIGPTATSVPAAVTANLPSNVVEYGQTVAYAVTFSGAGATAVGGNGVTVTFIDNTSGTVLCQAAPVANNVATCSSNAKLAVGTHTITVSTLIDSAHVLGAVLPLTLIVHPATTSLTLNTSANTGQVDLTATVSVVAPGSGMPTGTVQFTDTMTNSVVASTPLTSGVAKATIGATTHPIKATYSGDTNFVGGAATQMVPTNGASYQSTAVASDEILVIYGTNLTSGTGTQVQVTDAAGNTQAAQILYASASQINCVLPSGIPTGLATLTVSSKSAAALTAALTVTGSMPGIFSADSSGSGVAAANVERLQSDGSVVITNAAAVSASGALVAAPIELGSATDQVYVVFYGTGIRHVSALSGVSVAVNGVAIPVQYAGATLGFAGLDQVNVGPLPSSLHNAGVVNVVVTVDGKTANTVTLTIQ